MSDHDETFQTYSSFMTSYKPPEEYESLLVKASKGKAQAVKAFQRRENLETSLVSACVALIVFQFTDRFTAPQAQSGYPLDGYAYCIAFERKSKKPDMFILKALYERAITEADKRRFAGEANAEEALRSFWTGYLDLLVRDAPCRTVFYADVRIVCRCVCLQRTQDVEDEEILLTFRRGLRSVPGSGELLARYMRFLVRVAISGVRRCR